MREVLDTRFFLEHLYSQDPKMRQKTIQKMNELKQVANGIIPTIVLLETVQFVCSKRGKESAEMTYRSINASGLKIEGLNSLIAKEAGILKSTHKNLPVGDCIIAAIAIRNEAKIISDDPHFDDIKETKRTWL